jgi:hypothetical protein
MDSITRLADREGDQHSQIGDVANMGPPSSIHKLSRRGVLILVCVWVFALIYMGCYLKRSWVPHDEGIYGQSAERVLQGQLPHRDFDENYTGGLTFLNALACRVLGLNLGSIRIVLFLIFSMWVPCVFYISSQFVSPPVAGLVTLLCVAWSVPNYSAAVPSWYNLFFATFGIAALFYYLDVRRHRWLMIAGVCAGCSILAKITGIYFVFAVVLFLLFSEQAQDSQSNHPKQLPGWFTWVLVAGLVVFAAALVRLIHNIPSLSEQIYYTAPTLMLGALLVLREITLAHGRSRERFAALIRNLLPFATGATLPILVFLTPYWITHSVHPVFHALFTLSKRHIFYAATIPPDPQYMCAVAPVALVIIFSIFSHQQGKIVYGCFLTVYLSVILLGASNNRLIYGLGWCSIAYAVPLVTLTVAAFLFCTQGTTDPKAQCRLLLVAAAMAEISVVQFPFSASVYFCYVAPFVILTVTGFLSMIQSLPRFVVSALITFYLLFCIFIVTPGFNLGPAVHEKRIDRVSLTMQRGGGLRVPSADARLYDELIRTIQSHTNGQFIYAAPDCPEVYFLAGLNNPTRTFFDFRDEFAGRSQRILRDLEVHQVSVVAINRDPGFSDKLEPDIVLVLEHLYPYAKVIGKFQVRWREQNGN